MKTEVKKLDSTKREINVEVSGEIVKNKFEEIFTKLAKEAKVPGFRVGHVPRDILEKQYSNFAQEQALKELIPDIYHQAIAQEGMEVIELPDITDVKLDRNTLSFKAKVEVSPEIAVKNYKGLKVHYKKITVSEDEVKRQKDALKESHQVETLDDNFAKSLGYPNLSELEGALQRQIYSQKENLQRQKIESEIIENITKDLDFKLSETLIKRQLQELVRQAKLDLALRGLTRDEIEEREKTLSSQLEPEAKKQVQVYLVLGAIAKKENIPLDDHMPRRVIEFLLKEADWQETT